MWLTKSTLGTSLSYFRVSLGYFGVSFGYSGVCLAFVKASYRLLCSSGMSCVQGISQLQSDC